jgi:(1->4)-alpha-D-glucan 1-alpha-D-glucosylmutase
MWDDSLVDPDNRRAVDYPARHQALAASSDDKLRIVTAALHSRTDLPDSYASGGYAPVLADGDAAQHLVAFTRADDVLVAIRRWTVRLADVGWRGTSLALPDGEWTDRLTGRSMRGRIAAADLFADLPGVLLERTHA